MSLRIVPDQELENIAQSLLDHLRGSFDRFQSPNQLSVRELYLIANLQLKHVVGEH